MLAGRRTSDLYLPCERAIWKRPYLIIDDLARIVAEAVLRLPTAPFWDEAARAKVHSSQFGYQPRRVHLNRLDYHSDERAESRQDPARPTCRMPAGDAFEGGLASKVLPMCCCPLNADFEHELPPASSATHESAHDANKRLGIFTSIFALFTICTVFTFTMHEVLQTTSCARA